MKVKIPLKSLVTVDVTDYEFESRRGDEAISNYLINKKQFHPVKLSTRLNTYAGKIEFGIDPGVEDFTKEDRLALDEWCERKVGIQDPVERKDMVRHIIQSHRARGTAPRPWFRPAIWSVYDDINELFDNGAMSFYDLAVEMKERAQENLEVLNINYTMCLSNSLTVENLTNEEYHRWMGNQLERHVLDEYWDRYRKMNEVIPNDDDRDNRDKQKAEWKD